MGLHGLLVTPQLISVKGFAFRGRPMILLVACVPAGSHPFRFSRRSLRLVLQSAARRNSTDETYVHYKKNEPLIKHVDQWFVFHLG
jgi:hypothetical protein